MKQSSILAFSGLLGFAAAVPFAKRDLVTVVVTEEVVKTIDITTTVWVAAGGAPTSPTSVVHNAYGKASSATSSTLTSTSKPTSSPVAAAVSQAVSSTPPVQSSISYLPSSISSSSSTTSISPISSTSTTSAIAIAPPSSTPSASAYAPPASTTSTTSQAPAPVAPVTHAATSCLPYPNPATTPGVIPGAYFPASCNSSSGGCSGDITYYDTGMGACGIVSTADEPVIAISYLMMGTPSNSNPLCGKKVTVHNANTGASAQATVVDKCMGCCDSESIDLSNSLFETLNGGSLTAGRVTSGISWYFND